ncbi:uncharacterized protein LOC110888575 [Helianthus annuus]|uniref:uncharacterized protein LOC110888575 n=1 Tax=Helianthus annuus TaxID=4232 RepID=UPI000B8F2A54|nr:uncharacterized protein LOC110888575 [Helianthus annuus]
MGEWSRNEETNIVRILRCFHICSGLKINTDKSNLYGVGVGMTEIKDMANVIGCKPESPPFKYLGLTVGANMNRVNSWKPVIETFRARLANWKSHLLSIGGRVVIIKFVMECLPSYYFSLYKAPKTVIGELESMIKKFFWGGSLEEKKMHWVAWDRVARHKKNGDLGLNKLLNVNISLLSKWGWRFKTEKNGLWKRVIVAIHSSRVGWECIPFKKAIGGVWCNIVKIFTHTKVSSDMDRWIWLSESDGSFSVKAVKRLLKKDDSQEDCFIMDWCSWVPAKVNIHAWRMEMDKIPSVEALKKRNVNIGNSSCPVCQTEDETTEHLFITCHVASVVWNGISAWCKIPNIFAFSLKDLLVTYKDLRVSDKKKDAIQSIIMIVCWCLWCARNLALFSNSPVRIDSIVSEVKALGFLWFANRSKHIM